MLLTSGCLRIYSSGQVDTHINLHHHHHHHTSSWIHHHGHKIITQHYHTSSLHITSSHIITPHYISYHIISYHIIRWSRCPHHMRITISSYHHITMVAPRIALWPATNDLKQTKGTPTSCGGQSPDPSFFVTGQM